MLRPFTEEEQHQSLKILRYELGFKPYALALYEHQIVELVGFPLFDKVGDRDARISIRLKVGDPTTLIEVMVEDVFTAEVFANRLETGTALPKTVSAFLQKIGPYLTTQKQ